MGLIIMITSCENITNRPLLQDIFLHVMEENVCEPNNFDDDSKLC